MSLNLEPILAHAPAFILVLTRLSGLLLFIPLLSASMVPTQVKVMLTLALGAAVYPAVGPPAVPLSADLYDLAPLMGGEILIGASIGILATVPLVTAQLAGLIMGQQMGLGLAQVFNPSVDIEGDNIGQILFFAAMSAFLVAGGLEMLYQSLVHTFSIVPLGAFRARSAPLELLTGLVGAGFSVALRVSMPVLLILALENLATGFISKTVPSLNIMVFGFPVRVLLGLVIVMLGVGAMLGALMSGITEDMARIESWVWSL
ncbi:MAG TPA: hypothetical protein DEB06_08925 [Phycisphaerales bacterium]|nr:hypothetical protein [Phycisphaerales bacterium]